jgi:hypothetical protein
MVGCEVVSHVDQVAFCRGASKHLPIYAFFRDGIRRTHPNAPDHCWDFALPGKLIPEGVKTPVEETSAPDNRARVMTIDELEVHRPIMDIPGVRLTPEHLANPEYRRKVADIPNGGVEVDDPRLGGTLRRRNLRQIAKHNTPVEPEKTAVQ